MIPSHYEAKDEDKNIHYLDNGASNHMTCILSFFTKVNKRTGGRVRFGDDSCVNIMGKGFILFEGESGIQKLLIDVFYILQGKHNKFGTSNGGRMRSLNKRRLLVII